MRWSASMWMSTTSARLPGGNPPFNEPGLAEVLAKAMGSGRLRFSMDIPDARGCAVHF